MAYEVELGHSDSEGGKVLKIKIEWWSVGRKTALKIDTPLASDIVCDEEPADT